MTHLCETLSLTTAMLLRDKTQVVSWPKKPKATWGLLKEPPEGPYKSHPTQLDEIPPSLAWGLCGAGSWDMWVTDPSLKLLQLLGFLAEGNSKLLVPSYKVVEVLESSWKAVDWEMALAQLAHHN